MKNYPVGAVLKSGQIVCSRLLPPDNTGNCTSCIPRDEKGLSRWVMRQEFEDFNGNFFDERGALPLDTPCSNCGQLLVDRPAADTVPLGEYLRANGKVA